MSSGVNPPRPYRSDRRREQAEETRRRILEAAHPLLVEHGYPGTTIEAIAAAAGVAVPTVYTAVGTKRELLAQLVRLMVRGDEEPTPLLERAGPQAVRLAESQAKQLRLFASDITQILERVGPLMDVVAGAAGTDPQIAELQRRLQQARFGNLEAMVGWLLAKGPLRSGLTQKQAAETVWVLTSPETHRLLRRERGWTKARYTGWLADSLIALLLPGR